MAKYAPKHMESPASSASTHVSRRPAWVLYVTCALILFAGLSGFTMSKYSKTLQKTGAARVAKFDVNVVSNTANLSDLVILEAGQYKDYSYTFTNNSEVSVSVKVVTSGSSAARHNYNIYVAGSATPVSGDTFDLPAGTTNVRIRVRFTDTIAQLAQETDPPSNLFRVNFEFAQKD